MQQPIDAGPVPIPDPKDVNARIDQLETELKFLKKLLRLLQRNNHAEAQREAQTFRTIVVRAAANV
jgi:hypothetical protein